MKRIIMRYPEFFLAIGVILATGPLACNPGTKDHSDEKDPGKELIRDMYFEMGFSLTPLHPILLSRGADSRRPVWIPWISGWTAPIRSGE